MRVALLALRYLLAVFFAGAAANKWKQGYITSDHLQGVFLQRIEEIDPAWYEGVDIVGLTAGASVPDELLEPIIEDLKARGVTSVEPVVVANETNHSHLVA